MSLTFDTVLTNARIFDHDDADCIVIDKGRIVHVGRDHGISASKTLDLSGGYVLPGFIDSHAHLLSTGLEGTRLNLFGSVGKKEAVMAIEKYAQNHEKVIAYRWDESKWDDDRTYITSSDLSRIEKPVVAFRRDGHMAVANEAAMRIIGDHRPDGIFREKDMEKLDPIVEPDENEAVEALQIAVRAAASLGITGVRDMVDRVAYDAYGKLRTGVRIFKAIYSDDLFHGFGSHPYDWGVKTFLDGSLGSRTAAHEGWDMKNLKMDRQEFESFCNGVWSKNLPVAVHAIGEIAVRVAADTMHGHAGRHRNSIEHFELVEDGVIDLIDENTIISAQPNFLEWAGHGGMYEDRLGKSWLYRNNPYRDILDRGLKLAFGSDSMPLGPMYGIYYAVNSEFDQQRVSFEEAVRSYSESGSYLLGTENWIGRIETGYSADFAIFRDQDIINGERMKNAKPVITMVAGNTIHEGS
ncbi:MAG: amidohydrolase [Thermoplasma sp.]|nr:MAG: amidohydrolase [Thermoplasma sp.]